MLFTACTTTPKPNNFIKFQDEKAKLLCVKNWDTNGDGQLSYDEAATVTELGGVFNRSAISSFDELKYFTCLAYLERGAFAGCTSLTSVTIPESVTSIDAGAFYGCSSLASITIPNSVTSIGAEAFAGCYSLASITIPESVTEIGRSAFKGCTGELIINSKIIEEDAVWLNEREKKIVCKDAGAEFTKLTIGDNITRIGSYAFEGFTSLTSVTIGNSVTSIGSLAFYNCESLTSITIPHSVTLINSGAFEGCNSLTDVNYTGDLSAWCKLNFSHYGYGATSPFAHGAKFYINGVEQTDITIPSDITEIKYGTFSGCTSLTSVTIPDSVTSIEKSAFSHCTSLTSVIIPNSITEIGEDTFYYCTSLTSVTIPNSVTKIGESAFNGCSSLTSVTIPESVTKVEERAFNGCTSLTSVTIPESVTWVGKYAFSNCTSLTSVTIPSSDIGIDSYAFQNCTGELIINSKRIVEPDSYSHWNKDSKFTKLTIGDNITKIGYTFHGCTSLESVTIPNSVTEIGKSAFWECSSLTSVTIPESVTKIGESAFYECSSLTSVTIPESVTKIGEWAFASCTSLASVYCKATTPPSGDRYMFYKSASDRKIYVPRNSVDAYKSAEFWSDYADHIEGYDF